MPPKRDGGDTPLAAEEAALDVASAAGVVDAEARLNDRLCPDEMTPPKPEERKLNCGVLLGACSSREARYHLYA